MPIIINIDETAFKTSVSDLNSRLSNVLNDEDMTRYTFAERIDWMNEAVVAIANRQPQSQTTTGLLQLDDGCKQILPQEAVKLLEVRNNISVDGSEGAAITQTTLTEMDAAAPGWRTGTKKTAVRQFMFDDRDPKRFWVWPPVIGGTLIDITYLRLPKPITESEPNLPIPDEYAEAVLNFVAYRCLLKDSEYANGSTATAFYQAFLAALGMKEESEMKASPNNGANR